MSFYLKLSSYLVVLYLSYKLRVYLNKKFNKNALATNKQIVLFFPETRVHSRECYQTNCDILIANNPKSNLCQLLSALKSCQKSLDVCMYCMAFDPIIKLLQDLSQNKAIVIRIITNGEKRRQKGLSGDDGNKLDRMRQLFKFGIQLKIISLSNDGLMHNKFAIIDNYLLINGSLNWTENAIFNSYNDCIITSDSKLVLSYSRQFNQLWSYDSF